MRRRRELQENPVLAADKLLLLREAVVLAAEGIGGEARAVGLVGGQALDRVDAVGGGGGALVRREVADEVGAAARDRLAPVARVGDRKSTRLNSTHTCAHRRPSFAGNKKKE